MIVKIKIFKYGKNRNIKNLINELKNKQPTIIEEDRFDIDLELNVNSFDEVISLLEKYSEAIEIELSILAINKVRVWISAKKTWCSLGDQVD